MSCAPTTTVATPTMAAAAVPSAAGARHRLGIERLTVVIVFLQLLLLARSSPGVLTGWSVDLGFCVLEGVVCCLHVAQAVGVAEEFEGSALQRGGGGDD